MLQSPLKGGKLNLVSTRKILKYIDKHPNCSYLQIARDLFDNDIFSASKEIIRNKEYINGRGTYHQTKDGQSIKTINYLSINSFGKQKLDMWLSDDLRFRIPLVISIIAIIVAILSAYFTYLQI